MKLDLHCFSGTGNTVQVARWMAQESNSEFEIRMIGNSRPPEESGSDLTGMLYPTHGFTAPWAVIRYAARMPRVKGKKLFLVATRGMSRPGPLFVIGAELSANMVIAVIMLFKGYRIQGITGIDMPQNWTALFWGLHSKNVKHIHDRAKLKSKKFIQKIISGKKEIFTLNNVIMSLLGLALLPVSFLYIAVGHFLLAKLMFVNGKCNGCGVCASNCPVNGIFMIGRKHIPYWKFSCESCMRCINYCPQNAIEASHHLLILYILSVYVPLVALLDAVFEKYGFGGIVTIPVVSWSISYAAIIAGAFLVYLLFWLLARIKPFKIIFTYTTLTHYYRRYHSPEIKLKDME